MTQLNNFMLLWPSYVYSNFYLPVPGNRTIYSYFLTRSQSRHLCAPIDSHELSAILLPSHWLSRFATHFHALPSTLIHCKCWRFYNLIDYHTFVFTLMCFHRASLMRSPHAISLTLNLMHCSWHAVAPWSTNRRFNRLSGAPTDSHAFSSTRMRCYSFLCALIDSPALSETSLNEF